MSTMKYASLSLGMVEAVFNKLGGMDGAQRFLSGELTVAEPVRRWREENGVIYFEVTSDGTSGLAWIERLEKKGFRLSTWAKIILNSTDFNPTNGVTYRIAVLRGALFAPSNRTTDKILANAECRALAKPNAEVACLIREMFSDEELRAMDILRIMVFHEPVGRDPACMGVPSILCVFCGNGGRWLDASFFGTNVCWRSKDGFAFAVS